MTAEAFSTIDFRIQLDSGQSLFAREVWAETKSPEPSQQQQQQQQRNLDDFLLIVVHGGPGLNSHEESFEGLKNLLSREQYSSSSNEEGKVSGKHSPLHAIIFYDQLGCGRSDVPPEGEIESGHVTLAYYVTELQQVIKATRLRHAGDYKICLLGHSWGGQIVLEYLLQHGKEKQEALSMSLSVELLCHCAIVSNAPLDETTYEQKQRDLRAAQDETTRTFMDADDREQSSADTVGAAIYRRLIGLSETKITGQMAGWDALKRLGYYLPCPCLFVTGKYDTVPYEEYEQIRSIQYSLIERPPQVLVLENGDHGPFYGETMDDYFAAVINFLSIHRNVS